MAAPKPETIVEILGEVARLLEVKGQKPRMAGHVPDLEEAYRWLHGAAHAPIRRDHERVSGGSDPTSGGQTAAVGLSGRGERGRMSASTQDHVRRKLEAAATLIVKGTAALRGAGRELARAFDAIDKETERRPSEYSDPVPPQEPRSQIELATEAQRRREARGEVYAEDALPTGNPHDQHTFVGSGLLCRYCAQTPKHPVHVERKSAGKENEGERKSG